jgi:hypothetical protein
MSSSRQAFRISSVREDLPNSIDSGHPVGPSMVDVVSKGMYPSETSATSASSLTSKIPPEPAAVGGLERVLIACSAGADRLCEEVARWAVSRSRRITFLLVRVG